MDEHKEQMGDVPLQQHRSQQYDRLQDERLRMTEKIVHK